MKRKIIFSMLVVLLCYGGLAQATITNVSISPITPTFLEPITILVSGEEGSGPVQITDTNFVVNGNTLSLDIYLDLGGYTVMTPWTYSEIIGVLPADTYSLTVRRFLPSYYPPNIVVSSYSTSFEVVPEPTALISFTVGLLVFRVFSKKI